MFRHYFLNASRYLLRNPVYSLINVVGLAIGLAACIFIFLWVWDELSYDRYFKTSERIYRVIYQDNTWTQPRTPHPLALAMAADFPGVENGVSLSPIWGIGLTRPEHTVRYMDIRFEEKEFLSADSTFFALFPLPFIEGNPAEALSIPYGLVISQSTAHKYFGNEPALGKSLEIDGDITLTVTGVTADVPHNTHFTYDFLISYVTMKSIDMQENDGRLSDYYTWNDFGHFNYIVLSPGTDPKYIEGQLLNWLSRYIDFTPEIIELIERNQITLLLQPLTGIHLHSHMVWELGMNGDIVYVYAFSLTALLILVIAILNFINLSTARSEKRTLEAGVRKTLGALRGQLIRQFMGESFLLTLISVVLTVLLVELLLPSFSAFTGKNYEWILSGKLVDAFILILLTIVIGILAGTYPSLYFTSFSPEHFFKAKGGIDLFQVRMRKILVVVQFVISIFLIIATLGINDQLKFIRNRDPGFNLSQVLVVPLRSNPIRNQFRSFRETLLQEPGIINVSGSSNIPGGEFNNNSLYWKDPQEFINASEMWVDDHFFDLMEIEVISGRMFSNEFSTDSMASFILNEKAWKGLNIDDPIGEVITWEGDNPGTIHGKIIGIVRDFNFRSLHDDIAPLIIQRYSENWQIAYMLVRLTGENIARSISYIEKSWKKFEPDQGFNYSFLDEDFEKLYQAEEKMTAIFKIFTLLGITVAALGLLGLSAFLTEQRTKEIGIRKVHGSTNRQVFGLLIRDVISQVLIASLISWPFTWYLLHRWLQNYAYHTEVKFLFFPVATLAGALVAMFVTGLQSYRTATRNPVDALRYE